MIFINIKKPNLLIVRLLPSLKMGLRPCELPAHTVPRSPTNIMGG